ncbi:MAG: Ppx/GppA phosphatase family protein [Proteobacteria bacterium]|nr:Ppx/GppA phosphatase family protein [Pseudomonadota bacterium]
MAESSPTASGVQRQLAAVDLGSNSFHLLVAQETGGRLQVLDRIKEMVRLAEGLDADRVLQGPAVERAYECLQRFGQRIRDLPRQNVRVVGTNTLREADNADEFLKVAADHLGHGVEVISGLEEARLIYLGVSHAVEDDATRRLVLDIGGGSTEVILGRRFEPQMLRSLYLGCVEMSQRFFTDGVIEAKKFDRAVSYAMQEFEAVQLAFKVTGWDAAIGSSGTITAVSNVINELTPQDVPSADPTITRQGLDAIRKHLIKAGQVADIELNGLPNERRAVFPGGVAILQAFFDSFGLEVMGTTQGALREGLMWDLIGRHHQDDTRNNTVADLAGRYRLDLGQSRRVRESAISLLAQVADDWELLDSANKLLLTWAADLHEIGMEISHNQYHKHGGYLLQYMDMPGFTQQDQAQLALLTKAHRRKLPVFEQTPQATRLTRLITLLRISAVLHRSRSSEPLPHISAKVKGNQLILTFPADWMNQHPLTRLDLDQEAAFLSQVPIELKVKSG